MAYIGIKRVDIGFSENDFSDFRSESFANVAGADALLKLMARTAPDDGSYHKTDFKIVFQDDRIYEGRYDLVHADVWKADILRHVRENVSFLAGLWHPSIMTEEQYQDFLSQTSKTAEYLKFWRTYDIGQTKQQASRASPLDRLHALSRSIPAPSADDIAAYNLKQSLAQASAEARVTWYLRKSDVLNLLTGMSGDPSLSGIDKVIDAVRALPAIPDCDTPVEPVDDAVAVRTARDRLRTSISELSPPYGNDFRYAVTFSTASLDDRAVQFVRYYGDSALKALTAYAEATDGPAYFWKRVQGRLVRVNMERFGAALQKTEARTLEYAAAMMDCDDAGGVL